jgi:predicted GNAT family acetyltransferase
MNVTSSDLHHLDRHDLSWIRRKLTHPGSDFNVALAARSHKGRIAVVRDMGEIVGWCRSEEWRDADGVAWNTLEAFVSDGYRMRGIASLAAKALCADFLHDTDGAVAVFAPAMMLVARSAGLMPTLFRKDTTWIRA